MRRILGVFMALFMCCVPIGIQAEEEVLSFEYTGQKIEIENAEGYYSTTGPLKDAPIDCGKYYAVTRDGYVTFEINPKKVLVNVSYNKDWREGDSEEKKYLCKFDGDYEFKLRTLNGNFVSLDDYEGNIDFQFEPKNVKDVEVLKTRITHPDAEYVYSEDGIKIYSDFDKVKPIQLKDVGEYTVVFDLDERYYESVPFKVTILPKTIELQLPNYQKYVGEKDPVLETDDYILIREPGEEIGNYNFTVKSKSKNYKYEIVANDTFTILDSKQQSIRPEEKEDPLVSINPSHKDKNKYASATDMESNNDIETKVDKESQKKETKVVTGVSNFTSMYYLMMLSCIAVIIYILIKKRK
ncbi:hypothetical protein [Holdemanella porci]|uniref:hypothetical protein n=1 Tax=Holdemanella porci TaxID=2652276 RepID=UPI0022E04246|nr:hypothetical protein [Holdemanella porci]